MASVFIPLVKQHGALLAKGRLLGVQFEALFSDGLYMRIAEDTVAKAVRLRKAFEEKGYSPAVDSPTNQQFFRLPNSLIERLRKDVSFEIWGTEGETDTVVRFVTGWSTTDDDITTLSGLL